MMEEEYYEGGRRRVTRKQGNVQLYVPPPARKQTETGATGEKKAPKTRSCSSSTRMCEDSGLLFQEKQTPKNGHNRNPENPPSIQKKKVIVKKKKRKVKKIENECNIDNVCKETERLCLKEGQILDSSNCSKHEQINNDACLDTVAESLCVASGELNTSINIVTSLVQNEPCKPKVIGEDILSKSEINVTKEEVEGNVDVSGPEIHQQDDWETLYDDGMYLNSEMEKEITARIGKIKIFETKGSYQKHQSEEERESNGENIIEIYGFPSTYKTQDLMTAFSTYSNRGFFIKWVDDTHALGIFSTVKTADEVLASNLVVVKTRPLRLGIPMSKEKAKNLVIPPFLRPKTCAAMAKRLVTGALGIKVPVSPADREAEKKLLAEAREQRRLAARQRDAAWEGTLSST